MFPEQVIEAIVGASNRSANSIGPELGHHRSHVRNVRGNKEVQLATVADIADVCGMDVVIIDRATGKQVCKVGAPRYRAED